MLTEGCFLNCLSKGGHDDVLLEFGKSLEAKMVLQSDGEQESVPVMPCSRLLGFGFCDHCF